MVPHKSRKQYHSYYKSHCRYYYIFHCFILIERVEPSRDIIGVLFAETDTVSNFV